MNKYKFYYGCLSTYIDVTNKISSNLVDVNYNYLFGDVYPGKFKYLKIVKDDLTKYIPENSNIILEDLDSFFEKKDLVIPKVIFQTSKNLLPSYLVDLIKLKTSGWEYKHFLDKDIILFFKENYLDEFPDIINKFTNFTHGAHKADLFRYYYLYIKGGVYLDTDASLECNLDSIVGHYEFTTVYSIVDSTMFNGFIGATPKHKIVYEALKHIYYTSNDILQNNYLYFCRKLYTIVNQNINYNVKLYQEISHNNKIVNPVETRDLVDNKLILRHYWETRVIPNSYQKITGLGNWCTTKGNINLYFNKESNWRHTKKGHGDLFDWMFMLDYSKLVKALENNLEDILDIKNIEILTAPHDLNSLYDSKYSMIWNHLFDLYGVSTRFNVNRDNLKEVLLEVKSKINYLKNKFISLKEYKTLYVISFDEHTWWKYPHHAIEPSLEVLVEVRNALSKLRGNSNFTLLYMTSSSSSSSSSSIKYNDFENIIVRKNVDGHYLEQNNVIHENIKKIYNEFDFDKNIWF